MRLRVGIVGLRTDSWGAMAHVPALRSLSQDYDLHGVANTSIESAKAVASFFGIPKAFGSASELVASPDIDIVVVTVKVPHHYQIVKSAIAAGKHVYCEWPLGNGLAEAEELTQLAQAKGILSVVGTQARFAPEIRYLKQLLAEGFAGDVLSTSLIGSGLAWGPQIDRANAYLHDQANGATMLTIPVGHALSAVQNALGNITVQSAMLAHRRTSALVAETGERQPMTAHDQVLVGGVLDGGAPISLHYRGGTSRGTGFLWEINGTEGDLRITAPVGHPQMVPLILKGARSSESEMRRMEIPSELCLGLPREAAPCCVAGLYAAMASDLRKNTRTAPRFSDAVELHRTIAAIEAAAIRQA